MKTELDWLSEAITHYKKLSNALGGFGIEQRRAIFLPFISNLDEDNAWAARQKLMQANIQI